MKVAFQGEKGAYSEEAIIKHYPDAVCVSRSYLKDVFDAVEAGEADYGMVPIENTIQGSIVQTYDLLYACGLKACGEVIHRIQHCLIANPGSELGGIKKAYSHPQALGQSREWLEKHGIEAVSFYDTAGSVKWIKENNLREAAAVASARAAEIYGMKILARGIETNPENYTRFIEIGYKTPRSTGEDKTILAFIVPHRPGALMRALKEFSERSINIEKIESRPRVGEPWEYVFFVEITGHVEDDVTAEALDALQEHTLYLKHLGSYPRA